MTFEIKFRGPGIKDLDPNGNPIKREPLIPAIEKSGVVTRSGEVGVDVASRVMTDIMPVFGNPFALKEIASRYIAELKVPELAILAGFMYQNQIVEPKEMEELLSGAVYDKRDAILAAEREKGLGDEERLTLGGIFRPGIKLETLGERNFAVFALAETFQMATRESGANSDLTKIFPQYAPLPVVKADSPFTIHTVNLASNGFCGCASCRGNDSFI